MSDRPMAPEHRRLGGRPGGEMSEHQPLPWTVSADGDLVDAEGSVLRMVGTLIPWPPNDPTAYANRDLIARSVAELSEEARRQVITAAEARGAALAIEQCRRLAEEAITELKWKHRKPKVEEYGDKRATEALRKLLDALPATPGLAAEVRRIEEERDRFRDLLPSEAEAAGKMSGLAAKPTFVRMSGKRSSPTCKEFQHA